MKFFQYAILENRFLWAHILFGMLSGKVLPLYMKPQTALLLILILSVAWEVLESFRPDLNDIYGSFNRFFLDAFGDVMGAFVAAVIVIF